MMNLCSGLRSVFAVSDYEYGHAKYMCLYLFTAETKIHVFTVVYGIFTFNPKTQLQPDRPKRPRHKSPANARAATLHSQDYDCVVIILSLIYFSAC